MEFEVDAYFVTRMHTLCNKWIELSNCEEKKQIIMVCQFSYSVVSRQGDEGISSK